MTRTRSTAEVARILGVSEDRVRELARSGLARPAGRGHRYAFRFRDLVALRAARDLVDAGVPAARVKRALASLVAELAGERPLSGLRIFADAGRVAVDDGSGAWQPETGQTLLDLELDALAREAEALRPDAADPGDAFARALELEDADPKAARAAYAEVLAEDPGNVDACVNLGRLAHEAGDAAEAVRLYHQALERSPSDPVIHYNLALALEDTAGPAEAAARYETALHLDPEFADAHFNLAGLCEQLGRTADAIRHFSTYRRLGGE